MGFRRKHEEENTIQSVDDLDRVKQQLKDIRFLIDSPPEVLSKCKAYFVHLLPRLLGFSCLCFGLEFTGLCTYFHI